MTPAIIVASGATTHPGLRRSLNEDAYLAASPVFLVADGMGGHEAGERASAAVIGEFARLTGRGELALEDVRDALTLARTAVDDLAGRASASAGTTLSGVVLTSVDGVGYWLALNVGDSRTYRLADGELEQISVDHSVVQELIEAGELSAADAVADHRRNVITRAIGAGSTGEADYWMLPAELGDRVLVCSDGLPTEVSDEMIREVLAVEPDPQTAADVLVAEAVRAGGRDNITVVVVDAVSVASRPRESASFDEDVADTRPREAAAGGMR